MSKIRLAYSNLVQLQKTYREAEATYNAAKEVLEKAKVEFMALMDIAGTDTYKSTHGTVSVVTTEIPIVQDWAQFYEHISNTQEYDLLQRRISSTAWRERVEQGLGVPGTALYEKKTVRVQLS
jgi:hypothetical protein